MGFDWMWFDRHAGAIEALAAVGMLVFTIILVFVARRQANISAAQAKVAEKQADLQTKQHEFQIEQDKRAQPRLAIASVTMPRWAGGNHDEVAINFEVANIGGREIAPHAVLLTFTAEDGDTRTFIGRVHSRRGPSKEIILQPGDNATYTTQVPLANFKPNAKTKVVLQVQPFGASPSEPALVQSSSEWTS